MGLVKRILRQPPKDERDRKMEKLEERQREAKRRLELLEAQARVLKRE